MAERCFVAGIDYCIDGNSVFKERAQSWARRAIIKKAILMIAPELDGCGEWVDRNHLPIVCRQVGDHPLHHVIQLEPFERCVFVMSVLEHFCDHECSLLLNTTRERIRSGRTNAMEHLAHLASARVSKEPWEWNDQVARFQGRITVLNGETCL